MTVTVVEHAGMFGEVNVTVVVVLIGNEDGALSLIVPGMPQLPTMVACRAARRGSERAMDVCPG